MAIHRKRFPLVYWLHTAIYSVLRRGAYSTGAARQAGSEVPSSARVDAWGLADDLQCACVWGSALPAGCDAQLLLEDKREFFF